MYTLRRVRLDFRPPAFMAPELLSVSSEQTQYSSAIDVFSLGVIIIALWGRSQPYTDQDFAGCLPLMQAVQQGTRPTIPPNCPEWLATLAQQCWATNPKERITAAQVAHTITRMRAGNGGAAVTGWVDRST
jgi:serine/threonine protein kinase